MDTQSSIPPGAQPVVNGNLSLAVAPAGNASIKVDGATVSSNGKLDTTYLTNGKHTIAVTQGSTTSTRTIDVENKLTPWQAARNLLFASFHGNKTLVNGAIGAILVTIFLLGASLLLRLRLSTKVRTNLN
jgi:hypothetical protein